MITSHDYRLGLVHGFFDAHAAPVTVRDALAALLAAEDAPRPAAAPAISTPAPSPAATTAPAPSQSADKQRNPRFWKEEDKKTLRRMFRAGEHVSDIAAAIGKEVKQINSMVWIEQQAGRLEKRPRQGRRRRNAADFKAAQDALNNSMPGAEPYETVTCEETGAEIKRFKPGYGRGVWPQKNVGVR